MHLKIFFGLTFIFSQLVMCQEFPVYNVEGKEVDLFDEIIKEDGQDVIVFSWSAWYCDPCIKELDEINKYYANFSKENKVKIIALNIDNELEFTPRYDKNYLNEYGVFSSIPIFLKKFKEKHNWDFEVLSDPNSLYFDATGLRKSAPFITLFSKGEPVYLHSGFINGTFANFGLTYEFFNQIYKDFKSNISYSNINGSITSKHTDAFYKNQYTKKGNVYIFNSQWLSGEKYMDGAYEDLWLSKPIGVFTFYYKNGRKEFEGQYKEGYKEGAWNYYDENGKLTKTVFWDKGVEVSPSQNSTAITPSQIDPDYADLDMDDLLYASLPLSTAKLLTQSGYLYIGEILEDEFVFVENGIGTSFQSDGTIHIGYFKYGKPHGWGLQLDFGKSIVRGYWEKGEVTNDFIESEKSIEDVDITKRGSYSGSCENGFGIYIFEVNSEKEVYIGQWENGEKNGVGTYYFASGDVFCGEWFQNHIQGKGTYYYQNGSIYVGDFHNGLKHGKGIYVLQDNTFKKGIWNKDVYIGID
jgi:peroxiredoxin